MQVTIGVPSLGTWKDVMGWSLAQALVRFPCDVHFSMQRGPYLDLSRDACVTDALSVHSDYLFFVDSDMVFPPDAMARLLLTAKGKDITGGQYYEKRLPLVSTLKLEEGKGFVEGQRTIPTAPFRVAAVGTGFMVIDLARLTACMAPPFFAFTLDAKQVTQAWASGPGEDTAFCLRARKAGLSVWCDPTIPLLHSGEYLYGQGSPHAGTD